MEWWTELRLAVTIFIDRHGLLAACVALLIEEAGIPLPFLPADGVMLLLGIRARAGWAPLWQIVAALEAVTLLGSSFLYVLARRAGRTLLHRYGRVLHVTPARLGRAEQWLARYGVLAVFAARLVPGFRIAGGIACGVLAVPFPIFFVGTAAGALVSILLFVLLGYLLGPSVLTVVEQVHVPLQPLGSVIVLALIAVWTARARHALHADPVARAEGARPVPAGRRVRAGLAAGAVATLASALFMSVLVQAAGAASAAGGASGVGGSGQLAFLAPGALIASAARRLPLVLARRGDPLTLLVILPLFVAVGVAWGAFYGRAERRLRRLPVSDWGRGLLFALAPLTIALLVLLPVLGLGFPGSDAAVVATVGETIRHLAYGLVVSLTFPIFLTRHLGRATTIPAVPAASPQAHDATLTKRESP